MATKTSGSFGRTIRDRRQRLNLTLKELARRASISHTYLSHLELGNRHPSPKVVTRLANALGGKERELFIMAYPRAMKLVRQPATFDGTAWNEFSRNAQLRRAHNITPEEMELLSAVAQMGEAESPRVFLYVLYAIRLALEQ